jgi:cell division septation protein DedD
LTKDFFADTIDKTGGYNMWRVFIILILCVSLTGIGCNKKQDELDAIEQDATDSDVGAVMDSLEGVGGEAAETATSMEESTADQPEPEEKAPEQEYIEIEGFVIQLGSYSNFDLANYWAEKYQNREYPAFLRQVEMDGQTYHRLRIGVYDTYEEAREIGERLVDRYSATYWIDNNR